MRIFTNPRVTYTLDYNGDCNDEIFETEEYFIIF